MVTTPQSEIDNRARAFKQAAFTRQPEVHLAADQPAEPQREACPNCGRRVLLIVNLIQPGSDHQRRLCLPCSRGAT